MSETFEGRLEQSRRTPLYADLPKYQHVSRLGHEEVAGLLDGTVVVQEKLDGGNATVASVDGLLVIATRNQTISIGGEPDSGFNGLVEYVLAHEGIRNILRAHPNWILRGEWLVRHSLTYSAAHYGKLYIFDVQDRSQPFESADGTDFAYLDPKEYVDLLEREGVLYAPIIAELDRPTMDQLVGLATGPSAFGETREGVVIKRYDFRNQWRRAVWGKIIAADFTNKHHLHFGPTKDDPKEMRFVAKFVTDAFVLKTIQTAADLKGESPRIQHMPAVLGRVWHDVFQDELWDFVKEERVKQFDFQSARKLAETKTREVALAFYNGVPSVPKWGLDAPPALDEGEVARASAVVSV